jgi:predicted RNase H-like HicB family nuclease
MKLKVVIEKDESGYFVAEVPAMPGCYSQGKTIEEVKQNIREAIEGWIEVMNEKAEKLKKYEICEVTV